MGSHNYSAFIDTGSQASIVRHSVAMKINAERRKCSMKIKGICGGTCILTESIIVDLDIDGKIITAEVYIAGDHLLQEDFLLGQNAIISAQLVLNYDPEETEVKRTIHQPIDPVSNSKIEKLLMNLKNEKQRHKMGSLLERFSDVFSTGLQGIGKTTS